MYGYIYKTTNLITNKIYVGQKKSNKFLGTKYLGSGTHLKESVKHHGKENFTVEFIDSAETATELNEKEIYWIDKLDARNPQVGYNISLGGDGNTSGTSWNKGLTKEQDERLICSEQTRMKRSESLKRSYAEGQHKVNFTDEIRAKMSAKAKARPHLPTTNGKKVINNGETNKMVYPQELETYLSNGWVVGKLPSNKPAWNKGLTKDTNESVNKYSKARQKLIASGNRVGFCNAKGNHFSKGQKVKEFVAENC